MAHLGYDKKVNPHLHNTFMNAVSLPQTLLTLTIRQPEDVAITRQRARQIMALLGFTQQNQTQMTTAISEIVRNAHQYAGGGKMTINLQPSTLLGTINFVIIIEDKGPGIAQLASILAEHYISHTGQGLGIVGARRIVDLFSIQSTPKGTTVMLGMPVPYHRLPITYVLLSQIANDLALHRPKSASEEVEQQNQELLVALDQLTKARSELEQKVQERTLSLQAATEHLNLALQSAQAGTWHWHSQTNSLQWDTYTCTLLGVQVGCLSDTQQALLHCIHPDDRPANSHAIRDFLKAASEKTGKEFRILWPDGRVRYIMARGQMECNEYHQPKRISGIFWDITERKQAETELQAYQLQAAQAQRTTAMSEMASALAHELNQPLAAISAFARGCLRRIRSSHVAPEQLSEIIEEIAKQSERAGEVIHRIKNFVRKGTLLLEPVKVNILLETVIKLFNLEVHQYAIKINIVFPTEALEICVDKIQMEQVLLNLLRNSLEAMQAAATLNPILTIEITQTADERLGIRIKDNGPGFSSDVATQLFDAYFTTKPTGMGMGLAICRTIVEAHEGKLTAEVNPEGGACFHCILPLRNI